MPCLVAEHDQFKSIPSSSTAPELPPLLVNHFFVYSVARSDDFFECVYVGAPRGGQPNGDDGDQGVRGEDSDEALEEL
jgi:hypothetical protein